MLNQPFFMRGNIAPHDIIYYHLISFARKILFSYSRLEHAGRPRTSRPLLAIHRPTIYARQPKRRLAYRAPRPPPRWRGANRGTNRPHAGTPCAWHSRRPSDCRGRCLPWLLPCCRYVVRKSGRARAGIYI